MLIDIARVLPRPGPLWGAYPLRAADDSAPPWRRPKGAHLLRSQLAQARRAADAAIAEAAAWTALNIAQRQLALLAVRRRLRRDGLVAPAVAQALGIVSACAAHRDVH